jgi:hypothetical protein
VSPAVVRPTLAALTLLASGCFLEPTKPAATADAQHDGPTGPAPVVRKIASAWYSSEAQPSAGMTGTSFSIPTTGINNGDLVLFIGNVDNGNNTTWPLPTPQFHQLVQVNYGTDGQTFFAAWTIANNEPTVYAKPYVGPLGSGASTITLLAVTGADPTTPIVASPYKISAVYDDPAVLASDGVTTTAPDSLVIFAGGADWAGPDQTATFMQPPGYDVLDAFSDRGGLTYQWTTQLVADRVVHAVGPTGTEMGSIMATQSAGGAPWTVEIAVAPAPR